MLRPNGVVLSMVGGKYDRGNHDLRTWVCLKHLRYMGRLKPQRRCRACLFVYQEVGATLAIAGLMD